MFEDTTATEVGAQRAAAEALLQQAADGKRIALPFLTRGELATLQVLGRNQLLDEAELEWWKNLRPELRHQVSVAAFRGLAARGLITIPEKLEDTTQLFVPLDATPELELLLAIRCLPSFVLEGGTSDPDGGRMPLHRLLGVITDSQRTCVVAEDLEGDGVHRFELVSLRDGLDGFTRWACTPLSERDDEIESRIVDLGWPDEDRSRRWLLIASQDGVVGKQAGDSEAVGEARPMTASALRTQLTLLL